MVKALMPMMMTELMTRLMMTMLIDDGDDGMRMTTVTMRIVRNSSCLQNVRTPQYAPRC